MVSEASWLLQSEISLPDWDQEPHYKAMLLLYIEYPVSQATGKKKKRCLKAMFE